jgi:hypothetical protein
MGSSRLSARRHVGDVVVFDPQPIADRATFQDPHQYSVCVKHSFRKRRAGAEGWRGYER